MPEKMIPVPQELSLPLWLLERREIGSTTKIVLAALSQLAVSGVFELPPDEVARRTGKTPEAVVDLFGRLMSFGLLREVETGLLVMVPARWLGGPQGDVIPELHEPDELDEDEL